MTKANAQVQKEDVRGKVTSIISRVTKIPVSEITSEKLIREDLGVDSMQAIEALAILEKELNIVIDPENAFDVTTMEDLFKLVDASMAAAR